MKYFDSHSHYYDERFLREREGGADPLISALLSSDISGIVNVGTNPETCRAAIVQAEKYDNMYVALGIHPSDTRELFHIDAELDDIENLIKKSGRKCVCLGEIGLDYHYPDTDKEKQRIYFREQMRLAASLRIPVCIHDRDAHADVMMVIREFPSVTGILHSYSGGVDMARELCDMGYMISFSGTLTFTNARRPKEVAATVPHDRILIETDCPYLAPHPLRGTLNHSGNLVYTNATLASILGLTEEECAVLTEENARRFFGID